MIEKFQLKWGSTQAIIIKDIYSFGFFIFSNLNILRQIFLSNFVVFDFFVY